MTTLLESKITIRCALQSFSDKAVICPHDWTVFRLKEHLRDVCPCEPVPERQRLIYSGQCLKNSSKIGEILRFPFLSPGVEIQTKTENQQKFFEDQIHVFHLVYTPTVEQIEKNRKKLQGNDPQDLPTTTKNNNEGLRSRFAPVAQTEVMPTPSAVVGSNLDPAASTSGLVGAELNPQQYWMQMQQQMYSAYMVNYVNYVNQIYSTMYGTGVMPMMGLGLVPPAGVGPAASTTTTTAGETIQDQGQNQAVVAQPDAQQQQQQQQDAQEPAMNAQGGMDDEDIRDRDWLDWLYMGSRAMLLVMILYFYSSFERFIFVVVCCIAMYFWQAGWFDLRGGARNRQALAPRQQQDDVVAAAELVAPPAVEEEIAQQENLGIIHKLRDIYATCGQVSLESVD